MRSSVANFRHVMQARVYCPVTTDFSVLPRMSVSGTDAYCLVVMVGFLVPYSRVQHMGIFKINFSYIPRAKW